ncbi:MAG: signal peptidase I [Sandaracinaceae bacterium]|nr:signal peptidase I [Sandaracinaceae bacterium]
MDDNGGIGLVGALCSFVVYMGILAVVIAGMWKVFVKAGRPGWAAIVPIYNIIVLLQIARKPEWWFLLMLIPLVNFVIIILVTQEIAKAFGQSQAFGVGLALLGPVFYPILGFGSAQYLWGSSAQYQQPFQGGPPQF